MGKRPVISISETQILKDQRNFTVMFIGYQPTGLRLHIVNSINLQDLVLEIGKLSDIIGKIIEMEVAN